MVASSSTRASATTGTSHGGGKHDLFVSFRGEDIRDSFKSHLCDALSRKQINYFADDRLEDERRGDEIWPELSDAIEGSSISTVIFSKDYACSKRCLRELVRILDCRRTNGQIVIPVFYQVDPSDVRKQTASFESAFDEKHENVSEEEKKVWRAALREASNLSGWHSSVTRPESKLVDEIVKDVMKKLNDISPSSDLEGLVGIQSRIERVKSLLCIGKSNFEVVGIWGMGGIGKTTIAEAVFNQICGQFECHHFVANVGEESERYNGLAHLREKVISEILEEKYVDFGKPNVLQFVRKKLRRIKLLIVLDDMNTWKQLETLAKGLDGFGPGSRVIITTREKQLLRNYGVNKIYEVEALNEHEALRLFCRYAFKQDNPDKDLRVLAKKVVNYAKGNPLALKVVGSSLYRKTKEDWKSALHKLNKVPNPEIQNLLRISYDGLDREEKEIFLDIACFFEGKKSDFVTQILNSCYHSTQFGLNVLVDKSLITISDDKIEMHDLLQEMGHELVRQESINNPGERSRLHNHEDIRLVLRNNLGTEAIKGILLDMSRIKDTYVSPQVFEKMWNLRYLKLYNSSGHNCKVHGSNYLPDALRYLHWIGYPTKGLPSSFRVENLVGLTLRCSNLKQLWEEKVDAPKLKWLDLYHSKDLTRIPEFSNAPCLVYICLISCSSVLENRSSFQCLTKLRQLSLHKCKNFRSFPEIAGNIETLDLRGTAIEEVPSSIVSLTKLSKLDLSRCARIKHISPDICKLKSLRWLYLCGCFNLETFPEISEIMESLKDLRLSETAIKELPISIGKLNRLSKLELRGCKNLETLPSSISDLRYLSHLDVSFCLKLDKLPSLLTEKLESLQLSGCRGLALPPGTGLLCSVTYLSLNDCNLKELPDEIGCLSSLCELELSGNDFESLPESFKQLSELRCLFINDCNMLQSLTQLPLGLSYLQARTCKQLQSLPDASHFAELITECASEGFDYMFTNCMKLNYKALSIVLRESLTIIQREKGRKQKIQFNISLPGSDIPDWFSYRCFGCSVNVQFPLHDFGNRRPVGFVVCAVLAIDETCKNDRSAVDVGCKCRLETNNGGSFESVGHMTIVGYPDPGSKIIMDVDHVLFSYLDCSDDVELSSTDEYTTCSFQFWPSPAYPSQSVDHCKVKYCGVHPLCSPEPRTSIETNQHLRETKGCGRSDVPKEELEPNTVTICTEAKFTGKLLKETKTRVHSISNNVALLHRTFHKGVVLLQCYCWSLLLFCLFGGVCAFGLLVVLVLHLSNLCEIYLSHRARNM